jgi:hypothetical protein
MKMFYIFQFIALFNKYIANKFLLCTHKNPTLVVFFTLLYKRAIMSIKDRVQAVFVLQKFVRMSRFLLPAYFDLIYKKGLTSLERQKMTKIKGVYERFRASSQTSRALIDSDIVDLIKGTYKLSCSSTDVRSTEIYEEFIYESDELINKWNRQILN